MNAAVEITSLETVEDVLDQLAIYLRAPGTSRELKIETTSLGLIAKLYESGQLQAMGRGTSVDDAVAEALSDLGLS